MLSAQLSMEYHKCRSCSDCELGNGIFFFVKANIWGGANLISFSLSFSHLAQGGLLAKPYQMVGF